MEKQKGQVIIYLAVSAAIIIIFPFMFMLPVAILISIIYPIIVTALIYRDSKKSYQKLDKSKSYTIKELSPLTVNRIIYAYALYIFAPMWIYMAYCVYGNSEYLRQLYESGYENNAYIVEYMRTEFDRQFIRNYMPGYFYFAKDYAYPLTLVAIYSLVSMIGLLFSSRYYCKSLKYATVNANGGQINYLYHFIVFTCFAALMFFSLYKTIYADLYQKILYPHAVHLASKEMAISASFIFMFMPLSISLFSSISIWSFVNLTKQGENK